MDKYAIMAEAGFTRAPHDTPYGVERVAEVAAARIAELRKENAALKAERKWVPVSDGWPEKGQLIAARAFAGWDESEPGWVEVFDGNRGGAEFELWMPLPTPPTTEEDGQ